MVDSDIQYTGWKGNDQTGKANAYIGRHIVDAWYKYIQQSQSVHVDCTEATRGERDEKKSPNVPTLSSREFRKTPGYHNENGAARGPLFLHFNERMCRCQFFPVHSSPLYT